MSLEILHDSIISAMINTPFNGKPVDREAASTLLEAMSLWLYPKSQRLIDDVSADTDMKVMDLFFGGIDDEDQYDDNLEVIGKYFDEITRKIIRK